MIRLSEDQKKRIIETYQSGTPGTQLAKMFSVSTCAIYKLLNRSGVEGRKTWAQVGERKCCKCGGIFPMSEFYNAKDYWCKACWSTHRKENKDYDLYYSRTYGITEDQYWNMVEGQGSKCAICHKELVHEKARLYVDHDHKTGKVRGALCRDCNHGIGLFLDDTAILQNAIDYLNK